MNEVNHSLEPIPPGEDEYNEYERDVPEDIRLAATRWIASTKYNAFVTLTFCAESNLSYNRVARIFGRFLHRLKVQLFGRNSKKRLSLVPVIEKFDRDNLYRARGDLNTHVHVLIRFPGNPQEYKALVARLWKSSSRVCGDPAIYCPKDDGWFLTSKSESFSEEMAGYLTKTCTINTDAVLWQYVTLENGI